MTIAFVISIFIICTLIFVGILTSLWYGHKRYTIKEDKFKRWDFLANFILAIVAIFVGAFLAFQLSALQQNQLQELKEQTEKDSLLSVIDLSINEIDDQIRELESFSTYLKDKNSEKEAKNILNANPVEDIIILDTLIGNPLFPKYCSPIGTGTVVSFAKRKTRWLEVANDPDVTLEGNFTGLKIYVEYLEDLKALLSTEIDYLEGNITETEVLKSLDNLHHIDISEYSGETKYLIVPMRNWWIIGGASSAFIVVLTITIIYLSRIFTRKNPISHSE